MRLILAVGMLALMTVGCKTAVRQAEAPTGPNFRILTFNVNWGGPRPDLAAQAIRSSGAEIVCLQETTPQWELWIRQSLAADYPFMVFKHSTTRMGGGLAFLSKIPGRDVAYIPSDTGWFDGWIMKFETADLPVQVLNVHLRPPVSDSGNWVSGYLFTSDDRLREMKRFYAQRDPDLPMIVAGDFNDTASSPVVDWLGREGFSNALPQFDSYTPTWEWRTSVVTLRRRMDHVIYSPELHCCSARVVRAGASDHFPVEAVFTKQGSAP
jgi:endonuclease/exonuclease/phosphatase family metal-dependent hydrolase